MSGDGAAGASLETNFLSGGGELGALIRALDWSATPLGPPERWPHGLKTAVRIMLTSRQPMWVGWGPELTYLYNDPYKAIIGGKHPQALGQPTSAVWREIWDDIAPMLSTAMSGDQGTYVEAQLLIMERNGYPEETYYTFSYSPIPDDRGGTGGIICANTDDTGRVIRERQLALLRQLASAGTDARTVGDACALSARALQTGPRDVPFALLYALDDDGARLTLAATAGVAPGHPGAPQVASPGDLTPWPFADALRTHTSVVASAAVLGGVVTPGGWDRPASQAVVVPLASRGQDNPSGLLVLGLNPYRLFDETYRGFAQLIAGQVASALANARAYEQERHRAEALAEIDRAKTVFFSNVSHEFRTPLTLMLGPLDELRTTADAPEVREQATLVHRNALRLLRLVNTLLDFSRIEAGRAQAIYEPTDLAEYTRDLASTFRSAIERAGLRLTVSCPPLGEPVYIDRQMWEKVVLNLVSNAFKYTLDGEIEVSLARGDGRVELRVRDTGTGIEPEELPRLFERFHRIEGARGRTHEGTGIGLALVQELVNLHGGAVSADSTFGRGTTFTVGIPLGIAHLPTDRVRHTPMPSAGSITPIAFVEEAMRWVPDAIDMSVEVAGAGAAVRAGSARERIVLADDNSDMREYVRRLLRTRWDVEAVGNGREALAAVARQRPHLVITDVMMPELDGFGLLEALRGDPQVRDVPVVMLSARAGEEATLEGLHAGADDYLVKPFSARELIARVEAQLLRSRIRAVEEAHARRLAAVFAQAPVGIALLRGPEHVFETANPPYLELVGGRDVVGRPIRAALPELEGQNIFERLDRVRTSGEAHVGRSVRVTMPPRGGEPEERYFDFVYQPIAEADGRVDAIAVVAYDVTALARARREAEVANVAKDEFLAMLGHELRNPLAPILTALQLLKLRGIEAAEKERRVIERQVHHLVGLVDDLLDISRITRGKIQLNRAAVELADVIAKGIETASPLLERQGHQLRVDVSRQGLAVEVDSARIAQVIANLLTNAAKYTEPGGLITIAAREERGQIAISVRDTGIGIAPEMLPRVFELFVQERQAIDRAQGGLGLGLAIVRSLVTLHGGSVEARSDGPGRGAEFVVRLPPAGAGVAVSRQPESAGRGLLEQPARVRRVLIVDDNEDAAAMLAEAIGAYGHVIATAGDGPAALRTAAEFNPDVALLDIGLPVMDGYELARRMREHPALGHLRLVAVTGYGQEQDRQRSSAAGFAAHLVKPVDIDAVRAILET